MNKREKAAIAAERSRRLTAQTPAYTAVDGRTYRQEPRVPSGKPNLRTCIVRVARDRPSLMDVCRIEHWLAGKGRYGKNYVPPKERERIIAEYGLVFSELLQRYTAPEETLWDIFCARYGEKLRAERIESYSELMRRAKFRP